MLTFPALTRPSHDRPRARTSGAINLPVRSKLKSRRTVTDPYHISSAARFVRILRPNAVDCGQEGIAKIDQVLVGALRIGNETLSSLVAAPGIEVQVCSEAGG
jgi:hypothetical protein